MAERRRRAPRTSNAFSEIRTKLISEEGCSISEKMVALILKERPDIIQDEGLEIRHVGLMRLASEVNSRQSGPLSTSQLDLFSEYAAAPKWVVVREADDRGAVQPVHKPVDSLTLRQAKQYLADHMTPRPTHSDEIDELGRMVTDLSKHAKDDDWTLGECWHASRAKKRRRAA
jgi:hypothetical protein